MLSNFICNSGKHEYKTQKFEHGMSRVVCANCGKPSGKEKNGFIESTIVFRTTIVSDKLIRKEWSDIKKSETGISKNIK